LADYANARHVLPRKLLEQVQRYFPGGLLWVPPRRRRRLKTRHLEGRDQRLQKDAQKGISIGELSRKYGLSRERVRQILKASQVKN
jgi:DNA-directed RNA polymerase sigma subunit (sigma70/sigma32)